MMNKDNTRLREIQQFKSAYYHEMDKSESITDCLRIQTYIEELEREEKEILARGGVNL